MNDATKWTPEDAAAAQAEGWDVFECDSDRYGKQLDIEKCDDAEVFAEDTLAVFHVYDRALTGSALHRKALAVVLAESNVRAKRT